MTQRAQQGAVFASPVENLRIRFWGVQGSCPVHPPLYVIREYTRQIAVHTLEQAIRDFTARAKRAAASGEAAARVAIEDLLDGPATPEAIEAYQKRLGLPDLPVYGGETTCIEVETADGEVIGFDGGSGIRLLARSI